MDCFWNIYGTVLFLPEDCELCGNAFTLYSSDETWRSANEHEKPNMWKSLTMTWELWNKIHWNILLKVTWKIFQNHIFWLRVLLLALNIFKFSFLPCNSFNSCQRWGIHNSCKVIQKHHSYLKCYSIFWLVKLQNSQNTDSCVCQNSY